MKLQAIHVGDHGERVRDFQRSVNNRLKARGLDAYVVDLDGEAGPKTMRAAKKAAWALGALEATYKGIREHGVIPVGVVRMVRNPGKRNDGQRRRGKARMSHLRAVRKRRAEEAAKASAKRQKVVSNVTRAAANYRQNPTAYHYLAGGIANLIYLSPSPRDHRSDCSQFAASAYEDAGLPSPATVAHEWASTYTMAAAVKTGLARVVTKGERKPADLGMYGTIEAPHHVEVYCGLPGQEFVGHGSPPIDSLTPGEPDYYLTFDFLN